MGTSFISYQHSPAPPASASAMRHMIFPYSYIRVDDNLADFAPGTGAFTVEGFVRFTSTTETHYINTLFQGNNSDSIWCDLINSGSGTARLRIGLRNTALDVNSDVFTEPLLNTWNHWAFSRDGSSNLSAYWNGTRVFSGTVSRNFSTAPSSYAEIGIGSTSTSGNYYWVDEICYTAGVARYSGASITVPTSAFTTSDPFYSNVKLLLHFDGADGATTSTDATGRHSLTFGTNIELDTTQYKF